MIQGIKTFTWAKLFGPNSPLLVTARQGSHQNAHVGLEVRVGSNLLPVQERESTNCLGQILRSRHHRSARNKRNDALPESIARLPGRISEQNGSGVRITW